MRTAIKKVRAEIKNENKEVATAKFNEANKKIDKAVKAEPTKGEEDSPETTTKVEDSVNDPQEWFKQRIAEVGLAKASREYKIKFN
jgi:hypothetical protein